MLASTFLTGKGFDFKAIAERAKKDAAGAVEAAALACAESLIHGQLDGPASGRSYPSRRRDGSIHIASAPGEQPHADTEELIDHIEIDLSKNLGIMPQASVGWSGQYAVIAAALYDGTADGRIAPRGGWEEAGHKGLEAAEIYVRTNAEGKTLSVTGIQYRSAQVPGSETGWGYQIPLS